MKQFHQELLKEDALQVSKFIQFLNLFTLKSFFLLFFFLPTINSIYDRHSKNKTGYFISSETTRYIENTITL